MTGSGSDEHREPQSVAGSTWQALEQIEEAVAHLRAAVSKQAVPQQTDRAAQVRALIEARRLRSDVLPELFSDPAWDILLELYARHLEYREAHISGLVESIPVTMTTTLRWLNRLQEEGLIVRRADLRDAKRVWIDLSQHGRSVMDRYVDRCSERGLL